MVDKSMRIRRVGTAACFVLAAGLFFAGIVVSPWEKEDTRAGYFDMVRENPEMTQVGAVLLHFGFLLYVPALFGVLALLRHRGVVLGHVSVVLAALGLGTMAGFIIVDFYDMAIAANHANAEALAIDATAEGYWGIAAMAIPAFLGAVIGMPLVFVALWRAGWIHVWVPIVSASASVVMVVTPTGILWMGIFAALSLIVAGAVAWKILQTSDAAWARGTPEAQPRKAGVAPAAVS